LSSRVGLDWGREEAWIHMMLEFLLLHEGRGGLEYYIVWFDQISVGLNCQYVVCSQYYSEVTV
jgi:hypothetical protein